MVIFRSIEKIHLLDSIECQKSTFDSFPSPERRFVAHVALLPSESEQNVPSLGILVDVCHLVEQRTDPDVYQYLSAGSHAVPIVVCTQSRTRTVGSTQTATVHGVCSSSVPFLFSSSFRSTEPPDVPSDDQWPRNETDASIIG